VVGGQSDTQARAQFSLWCVAASPLIISVNLADMSAYSLETYLNTEAIAVNQDAAGIAGTRVAGGDLAFPCVASLPAGALAQAQVAPCDAANAAQQWVFNADGTIGTAADPGAVLDFYECVDADGDLVYVYPNDNGSGTCGGKNQLWQWAGNGTLVNPLSGKCLDVWEYVGPNVDLYACNDGLNQAWAFQPAGGAGAGGPGQLVSAQTGYCLTAATAAQLQTQCTNVWGRPLADGGAALSFVNNGLTSAVIVCDAACFNAVGLGAASASALVVRDLWLHANVTTLYPPFIFNSTVPPLWSATLYRVYRV
jgi:hypothetical protein